MTTTRLELGEPPRRSKKENITPRPAKLRNISETDKIQFNKRIPRATADGYEIMAVKLRRKVPDLLTEGLSLLEGIYGKI